VGEQFKDSEISSSATATQAIVICPASAMTRNATKRRRLTADGLGVAVSAAMLMAALKGQVLGTAEWYRLRQFVAALSLVSLGTQIRTVAIV
jgi:hypothetical protein